MNFDPANCLKQITVQVPGSSANLGPGFDTIALALGIYVKLTLILLKDDDDKIPQVTTCDANGKKLDIKDNTFVLNLLKNHTILDQQLLKQLRVIIESEIPLERGLGSSAAVIVALLYATDFIASANSSINSSHLLTRAAAIDGHPDNVAASLLGGLTVATMKDNKQVLAQKLNWPKQWCPILVVPSYALATSKARRSLPKTVSHADADYNVQHVSALLAAVQTENEELLQEALHDRLHENYRAELVPELDQLKKELKNSPMLGCVLSGAGSSVLVLVNKNKKPEVLKQIEKWQKKESSNSTILDLKVDQKGLQELP